MVMVLVLLSLESFFFFSREQVVHQGMDLLRAGFYLFRGDRQGFNEDLMEGLFGRSVFLKSNARE